MPKGTLERLATDLQRAAVGTEGPIEHEGGDRSLYLSDPEGNRVELWDFFHDGDGARAGVEALAS